MAILATAPRITSAAIVLARRYGGVSRKKGRHGDSGAGERGSAEVSGVPPPARVDSSARRPAGGPASARPEAEAIV